MRKRLWPTVSAWVISANQRADVSQLFFHTVSTGSTANAVFVTTDNNFLSKANELKGAYGITVAPPNAAWDMFSGAHNLVPPTEQDIERLWKEQQTLFAPIRSNST
ncbi:MAG TPA: hypothetical protein VMH88_00655 [Gemmatimonadales bacterium]|nr:hypothetical protein [Gemmatimonadales bacterium]